MPRVTFWRSVLLIALAGGLYSTFVRFQGGLGSSTALSDSFPWGLWVGFDVLCGVALAAGGFTISAVVYIFHLERYRPIVRPAILTAFLGYMLVIVALLFDLGRPWCIWHAMVLWNPRSVMFEVSWCVMLYTTVLALEFSPMLLERLGWKRPLHVVKSLMVPLVILGVLLSMLHQSSLGSLYLIVPHKMHPLWYTPALPLFFLVSALCLGCAMTIFESYLSHRAFRKQLELDILSDLGKVLAVGLALYLAVKIIDLENRGVLSTVFTAAYESRLFLAEIILGTAAPLALLLVPRVRQDRLGLFAAASMVVLGFVLNRLNISITALERAAGTTYVPSLTEAFVTLMFVAMGFLLFALAVRYLPVFPAEGHGAEAAAPAPAATAANTAMAPAPHELAAPLADILARSRPRLRSAVVGTWAGVIVCVVGLAASGIVLRDFSGTAVVARPAVADAPPARTPRSGPVDVAQLPEIVFRFQETSPAPVVFRHSRHVSGEMPSCTSCHGSFSRYFRGSSAGAYSRGAVAEDGGGITPASAPTDTGPAAGDAGSEASSDGAAAAPEGSTPEDILADVDFHDAEHCGSCHEGTKAFGVAQENCERCHEKRS